MMKLVVLLMTLGGLGLALWLALTNDTGAILGAFAAVGWGLGAIILVRLLILGVCGAAWALLLRRAARLPLSAYLSVRFIREAINVMLPVATVGGDIVGARLITFWSLAAGLAGASILVDLLLQASGQAVFATVGALLLAQVAGAESLVGWVLSGLGVAAAGLLGFYLAQRFGGVDQSGGAEQACYSACRADPRKIWHQAFGVEQKSSLQQH